MDVFSIIEKDGYKYDDLTDDNKKIIDGCNYLIKDIDTFEFDDYDINVKTTLGKIKKEISDEVILQLQEWLNGTIAELQISLIESQDNKDESND